MAAGMTVTVLSVSENNFRMHDLPVARTQTGHGITWGQLERQAVHLGKRFRLMAPQDHSVHTSPVTVIIAVEGPSATGKTTWCRSHATGRTIDEDIPTGSEPDASGPRCTPRIG